VVQDDYFPGSQSDCALIEKSGNIFGFKLTATDEDGETLSFR
jgi:hypothetical protein